MARRRERVEVGAAAERRAEVGGERADVGAGAALHADRRHRVRPGLEALDGEALDVHGAGRALHLLAAAGEIVEAPAADAQRAHHRRDLLDVADEAGRGGVDLLAGHRQRATVEHRAGRVERARRDAEHDVAPVDLRAVLEVAQQPGDPPEPDEQHAGRVRVERAGVPDTALPVDARRRRATTSWEVQPAGLSTTTRPSRIAPRAAARMAATVAGMSSWEVNPAAKR